MLFYNKHIWRNLFVETVRSDRKNTEEKKDLINKLVSVDHKCKWSALFALQEGNIELYHFLVEKGFPTYNAELSRQRRSTLGDDRVCKVQAQGLYLFVLRRRLLSSVEKSH